MAAYFFGFFFGRTPLIKLSPKKTWEGFIGASVTTIISAFVVSIGFFLGHDNPFNLLSLYGLLNNFEEALYYAET